MAGMVRNDRPGVRQPQTPPPAAGASPWMQPQVQTQTARRLPGGGTEQTSTSNAPPQMPGMYADRNSGNVFQWRPDLPNTNGGWSTFSTGQGDPMSMYARASSMVSGGRAPARVRGGRGNSLAAEAAEFSRAKDRIGLATQGLTKAIGSTADARGIGGSSLEAGMLSGALEGGEGQLADLIRQQAITSLDREYAVDDRDYAGDITQRGQDISLEAQRQQAIMALIRATQQGAY